MVKEIVGDDDDGDVKPPQLELFPSLEEIEVIELPSFTQLYKKIPGVDHINLQKLRKLIVARCGNLEIVFTLSMAKTLVHPECLTVVWCDKVKEIVENDGGGGPVEADEIIIFTKLKELKFRHLPNLESFCSATSTFGFPCLTDMSVIKCPEMKYFSKGDSITPILERVYVDYFHSCWENDLNATIHKMFMKTHPKEENYQETVPDDQEEGAEEGASEKVEDSVEEDTEEEDFEGGSGSS